MSTTTSSAKRMVDRAHHHPRVLRRSGLWRWVCDCGGASERDSLSAMSWHQAVVGALLHSTSIAP